MPSSRPGSTGPGRPPSDDDDALTFPEHPEPTDEPPTVISKNHPTVEPKTPSSQNHVTDLVRRPAQPAGAETVIHGLRGQKLAHFELIEPIGVGGMAAVLRARDTQLDRFVALKILPPDMATDPENVKRFHQEAKAAAKLDHENIARVYFCGVDQGLHFIAFEFVEGENLRAVLERRGRLPVAEAVRYILQVATGLEHAGSRGVVHRDIKPSNIIISPNGRAKLVDMGLARNVERKAEDLTQSGVTLGTFDYISPEQALEPREADSRSDIYSLGCTFYHMLTGQSPVPDGTAAKKLHHHQHVAPVDPRQLNPAVPDEVALVLGRMMAKNPRDRYQRPLQLVQHLMQVARKVGAADDVPEGVLFVDTPLPTGPRSRPLLMVTLAFLALGVVVVALSLSQPDRTPADPRPPVPPQSDQAKGAVDPPVPPVQGGAAVAAPDPVIRNAEQLADLLEGKGRGAHHVAKLGDRIDVGDPLTFQAGATHSLLLESADPANRAVLHFTVSPGGTAPAGLTARAGALTIRRCRIRLTGASPGAEQAFAAFAALGPVQIHFDDCIFEQALELAETGTPNVAMVAAGEADRVGGTAPKVTFNECYFEPGEDRDRIGRTGAPTAVALAGPANVSAVNCAFKPHRTFFHFQEGCASATTLVKLRRCSAFVLGPVFRFDEEASATLDVSESLFSRPADAAIPGGLEPNLILQAAPGKLVYKGKRNAYHNLNALWYDQREFVTKVAELEKKLEEAQGSDKESLILDLGNSPWQSTQPLAAPSIQAAFQAKAEFAGYGLAKLLGSEMPQLPDPVLAFAKGRNVKVVCPDSKAQYPYVFPTLSEALASAKGASSEGSTIKETIVIKPGKAGAEIAIKPSLLDPQVDLTLEPYPDTQPVLVLGKSLDRKDTAFFRLVDGRLHLKNLHFVLEPKQDVLSQSVVLLGENGQCTFTGCVITMKPGKRVPLNAVALLDPKDQMRMEQPSLANARVQFTNTFVRGEGGLINVPTCRLLDLGLDNSLFALTGPLLSVQGGTEDMPMEQGVKLKMSRVSGFAREALFSLRSSPAGRGLTKTQVESRDSLLAALESRPLVFLKAAGVVTEEHLRKYLGWQGERNCYANFDKLLNQERPEEMMSAMQLEGPQWERFAAETTPPRAEKVGFPMLTADLPLWQAVPEMFRPPNGELSGCGADLDALPKLKAES